MRALARGSIWYSRRGINLIPPPAPKGGTYILSKKFLSCFFYYRGKVAVAETLNAANDVKRYEKPEKAHAITGYHIAGIVHTQINTAGTNTQNHYNEQAYKRPLKHRV